MYLKGFQGLGFRVRASEPKWFVIGFTGFVMRPVGTFAEGL